MKREGSLLAGLAVVLDVGKTLTKLSLWDRSGRLIERRTRPNERIDAGAYSALDAGGIEAWLALNLRDFSAMGEIDAIVPVAHGAAVAVVRDGQLACPPMDYEEPLPASERTLYDAERDSFSLTGSPALPDGLNFGAQLHRLEQLRPGLLAPGATILPWAQYWAWRLSGVAASEVTSLGCHSDFWRPLAGTPSKLAVTRGWADLLAPVRRAGDVLGPISQEWIEIAGLPPATRVLCGLHDSNAALLAARGFAEIAGHEATVLSTGTWFVAMRTAGAGQTVDWSRLDEHRDCLINVDADGWPIPSARFMGGREIELLTGLDLRRIDTGPDQPALLAAAPAGVASGAMVLPTLTPSVGPFPHGRGRWTEVPTDQAERRALVCIYAALVANAALDLIGAREHILIEGRFAEAQVLVRALASLRPDAAVYVSNAHNDVSYGALRLLDPTLPPASSLVRVEPLDMDLSAYKAAWCREAERREAAA